MSSFEYLTVFLSVIFGLAVVQILSGVSLILDARERSRPYWVHLVWTVNVFTLAVVLWWLNFSLDDIGEWSFFHYGNLVAYSVLIFVLAGLLYPTRGPEVIDFRAHFARNRTAFFVVLATFTPVDVFNSFLQRAGGSPGHFGDLYVAFIAGSFIGSCLAIVVGRDLYHGLFGIAWYVTLLAWVQRAFPLLEVGGGS